MTPDEIAELEATKPVITRFASRDEAKAAMVGWIDNFAIQITGTVPLHERLAWDAKEAAARAIIAGNETPQQRTLISDEAAISGETTNELAAVIVRKADAYRTVVSVIAGLRRKTVSELDAVETSAEWETILLTARDEAVNRAKALGVIR